MPKKPKEKGLYGWEAAAERAGVSTAEFKIWVAEHRQWSGDRWSKWNSKAEPIPLDFVVDFLRDRLEEVRRSSSG